MGAREKDEPIARRPHNAPPTRDTGPRVNDRIRAPEIRLIGADGENVGVVHPAKAMDLAEEAGLDLVEISPNADPPVCKIMDFGKFKYEQQKRESEARKKQKTIEVKEVKFRPNTDTHDYDVKMRNVTVPRSGDKVKVTLRFRGPRDGAPEPRARPAGAGGGGCRGARQGREHAQDGRPPDGHDDRPAARSQPSGRWPSTAASQTSEAAI
jgi:translation initiation factor IF-3